MVLASISWVADALITGFIPTVLLLFASRMLWGNYRQVISQMGLFANILLLLGALLFLLSAVGDIAVSVAVGDEYEQYAMLNRITGPYWFAYTGAILCKGLLPQLLWLKRVRRSLARTALLLPFLLIDYWLPILYWLLPHRDYLPSSWAMLSPNPYVLAAASLAYLLLYVLLFVVARKLSLVSGNG